MGSSLREPLQLGPKGLLCSQERSRPIVQLGEPGPYWAQLVWDCGQDALQAAVQVTSPVFGRHLEQGCVRHVAEHHCRGPPSEELNEEEREAPSSEVLRPRDPKAMAAVAAAARDIMEW